MKRLIQIIQLPELHPLPVMKCVFSELTQAFAEDEGCEVRHVISIDQLEDGGIAFLDDAAGKYVDQRPIYDEIAHRCPTTVFVCWYWQKTDFRPFSKMIYTGEHWLHIRPEYADRIQYFLRNDFVPLKLRASESPNKVGTYPRNPVRDYCYMGGGYKMDWIPHEFTGLYHQVFYDNYLSYSQRRENYLSSHFALGFQGDENIKTGHLSQRIFEGLAYGCIVLCENPLASIYTDGIVVPISSKEELVEKIRYYKAHPEEMEQKRQRGYTWVKKHGTNRVTTALLLERIEDLFGYRFL